jgi:hypothetical protein
VALSPTGVTGSLQWLYRLLVLQALHNGSIAYSLSLITKSDHILCSQSLYYRLPKQNANQLTENKRLSSCAVFSDANINWREIEIPLGLHSLLMPRTPLGLHVNQKRELVAWIITKHRDLQHGLYRGLNGQ